MSHLRIKGPVTVSLVILIFLLEGTTMRSQARDEPNTVIQKLGSHSYAIPRDMIEMIYKPDWSKVPNPNPNWSHEPVIRLALQWPDFAAARKTNDHEVYIRKISIGLSSLAENPLQSVDDAVKSLDSKDLKPRIVAAEYGLQQLLTNLRHGTRDYIATADDQSRFLIRPLRGIEWVILADFRGCVFFGPILLFDRHHPSIPTCKRDLPARAAAVKDGPASGHRFSGAKRP
jgi:hypothetical protein